MFTILFTYEKPVNDDHEDILYQIVAYYNHFKEGYNLKNGYSYIITIKCNKDVNKIEYNIDIDSCGDSNLY